MLIAVIGGTGRVGQRLIREARAAGHVVRALARETGRLPHDLGAAPVTGDVTDPVAVAAVVAGTDAVLSALGGGPVDRPGTTLSQGMRNIVAAMASAGVPRVLAVAGSGVLDSPAGGLRGEAADFPARYRAINDEHLGTLAALRASQLDWTLVGCPDLVDDEGGGRYRVAVDRLPQGGASIPTGDVARFMVAQIPQRVFLQRRVGIAT